MLKKLIVQDFKNTKATMTMICLVNMLMGIPIGIHVKHFPDDTVIALFHLMAIASLTLPTTKTNVVVSKMIVTCIWIMLFILSILISFMLSYPDALFDLNPEHNRALNQLAMSIYNFLAFSLYIISQLMALFFCISLGQICKKHKKTCATLCYMVIGFASLNIFFYNFSHNYIWRGGNDGYWEWEDVFCLPTVLCAIALTAFSCAASIFITNKKLNLE